MYFALLLFHIPRLNCQQDVSWFNITHGLNFQNNVLTQLEHPCLPLCMLWSPTLVPGKRQPASLSDGFYFESPYSDNSRDLNRPSRTRTHQSSASSYSEAVRPNDYFKYFFERLRGSKGTHDLIWGWPTTVVFAWSKQQYLHGYILLTLNY